MNTEIEPNVEYYPDGKTVLYMEWRKDGLLHRENGKPALIDFWEDGTVRSERFYENGEHYREGDLPTTVLYDESGTVREEVWENASGFHS